MDNDSRDGSEAIVRARPEAWVKMVYAHPIAV
jgi:hypothetical protein